MYQLYKWDRNYRIFCFACVDPFALIHYVQLQFAVHLKRLLHTAIDSEQYKVLKNESVKNANNFS